jgi:acetyltransferase-like isoleucine patch superfamily enzyme
MRKIKLNSILVFNCLLILAIILAVFVTHSIFTPLSLGDFTGIAYTLIFVIFFYLILISIYRSFLRLFSRLFSQHARVIKEGSKDEFIFNIYLLFYLIPFHPLIKNKLIPVTFMRLIYIMLGAKLGDNTYSAGTILDPPLTYVGNNTIIGQDSILISHIIEGGHLAYAAIRIGNNVTIGANSVIMAGVIIENNAIVGAGAVVTKKTEIKANEVWGGIPAKKLRTLS